MSASVEERLAGLSDVKKRKREADHPNFYDASGGGRRRAGSEDADDGDDGAGSE